jgi:von Willebrand factor type A domain.
LQRFSSLTNINKALELARSVIMRQEGVKGGAVVMISDAEDDVENMGAAVRNLRKDDIRIYTIGVGMSEEIVERLSKDFKDDPGFRIFRADSEVEIQEAYRLIGNLEESPLAQLDQREFETDLRWFLSLILAVIGGSVILVLETGFHQTSAGRSAVQERGRAGHAVRAS